jgi:hypothetical protein
MDVDERDAVKEECEGETYYFCSEGCREKFLKERLRPLSRTSYDLIIIGGGPAGLTAAVYAATLKMNAYLITTDLGGQAIDSTMIEHYMGYDFVTGSELTAKFEDQLIHSRYVDHQLCMAVPVHLAESGFHVSAADRKRCFLKALILLNLDEKTQTQRPRGRNVLAKIGLPRAHQDFSFARGERIVAMASDEINATQAQVGVAMGTGTDVAMESAGVTLVKGDLRGIVRAHRLSEATRRKARPNLFDEERFKNHFYSSAAVL